MIYLFGDIHLREGKETAPWEKNSESLLKLIKNLGVPPKSYLIQTGDFFDSTKHRGSTNEIALEIVREMNSRFEEVIIITGNHESTLYSGNNLDILSKYATIIKEVQTLEIDGCKILCVPHIPGKTSEEVSSTLSEFSGKYDLILGHHFFQENTPPGGGYLTLPESIEYTYWMMGHSHGYEIFSDGRICLGSLSPCDKGEADNDVGYMLYTKGEIPDRVITRDLFLKFGFRNYSNMDEINPEELTVLTVNCKRAEKIEIEKSFGSQKFYEIIWDFEEEKNDEQIEVKSHDDLKNLFFKENKVSKEVKSLFQKYDGVIV
jgi:DNA repair exonuclease SbcCD nuclease subunit